MKTESVAYNDTCGCEINLIFEDGHLIGEELVWVCDYHAEDVPLTPCKDVVYTRDEGPAY